MITADLALAVEAATEAADIAMRQFRQSPDWWDKGGDSPVSEVDFKCDAALRRTLMRARPDYGWLSEETVDDAAQLDRRRIWVVDPIDGTRDYIRGRTGWCVAVALIEDHQVRLSAIAAPARGQLFTATTGGGAMLNGAPIMVSGRETLDGVRLPIDAANLAASFWPSPWPGEAVEKPNSLLLRIAKVASGEADAWVEGRTVASWDCAAAKLLIEEAGGCITDRHGDRLAFDQLRQRFPGLVAATPALLGEARHRLNHAMEVLAARRRARA